MDNRLFEEASKIHEGVFFSMCIWQQGNLKVERTYEKRGSKMKKNHKESSGRAWTLLVQVNCMVDIELPNSGRLTKDDTEGTGVKMLCLSWVILPDSRNLWSFICIFGKEKFYLKWRLYERSRKVVKKNWKWVDAWEIS